MWKWREAENESISPFHDAKIIFPLLINLILQQCQFHFYGYRNTNIERCCVCWKNRRNKINTTEKKDWTMKRMTHFATQRSILYHMIMLSWSHVRYIENFIIYASQNTRCGILSSYAFTLILRNTLYICLSTWMWVIFIYLFLD